MTRVVLVADSGPVLASLTAAVATVPGAHIVRHGSSVTRLDRLVGSLSPDLVVIGDLLAPADALRAKASAVLPGRMDPETLGVVLREVLAERPVAEVRELRPRLVLDAAPTGAAA